MRTGLTTVLLIWTLFWALCCGGCGGGTVTANVSTGTGSITNPSWSTVAVPSTIATNGASYNIEADGYLYAAVHSGAAPSIVNSMLRTPAASPGTWTDITGTGLSNGSEFLGAMGMTPGGTILVTGTPSGGGVADVLAWNGSTSNPVWTKVTGWNGISASSIYGFTNDSAGYTYFSPAWSGDIWRNDAPNSLNFTKVQANIYSVTNGGGAGGSGGIYALRIFNLGDGKGDMIWACGEGELDNIALSFSAASNTAYLTTTQGYTGNCTAIDKSATTILALRRAGASLDAGEDTLNSINIATRAVTVHPSPYPRTATSFPYNINMNFIGTLHWMAGTNWILTNRDASLTALNYLLLSTDDGNTWTDITASGGIDSSCTGANLSVGAVTTSQYIFARCQSGAVLWRYGPVS
jgi:hypothetical protein